MPGNIDNSNEGEGLNQTVGPEAQSQPENPASPVEAIRDGVGAELIESNFITAAINEANSYLSKLGLFDSVNEADLREIFKEALKAVKSGKKQSESFVTNGRPVYTHPHFNEVFKNASQICLRKAVEKNKTGFFYIGLQYLLLANEYAIISHSPMPQEILEHFLKIKLIISIIGEGELQGLFLKAKKLFPAESPANYKDFLALTESSILLKKIHLAYLKMYISQAKAVHDRQNYILLLREGLDRDSMNYEFLLDIAKTLAENGTAAELPEALEARKKIASCRLTEVAQMRNRTAMRELTERISKGTVKVTPPVEKPAAEIPDSPVDLPADTGAPAESATAPAGTTTPEDTSAQPDKSAPGSPAVSNAQQNLESDTTTSKPAGAPEAAPELSFEQACLPQNLDLRNLTPFFDTVEAQVVNWRSGRESLITIPGDNNKKALAATMSYIDSTVTENQDSFIALRHNDAFCKNLHNLIKQTEGGRLNMTNLKNLRKAYEHVMGFQSPTT